MKTHRGVHMSSTGVCTGGTIWCMSFGAGGVYRGKQNNDLKTPTSRGTSLHATGITAGGNTTTAWQACIRAGAAGRQSGFR